MGCIFRSVSHASRATPSWALSRSTCCSAAGVVIGAGSHVVWDGVTHRGGLLVSAIPVLQQQLGPFRGYGWSQYASGVLGCSASGSARGLVRRQASAVAGPGRPTVRADRGGGDRARGRGAAGRDRARWGGC
ncbi:DUF4184 domain-containing protein [Rathayibacter tritici]|nr:DUF4184 domain-containing protein [Rathayibacter tritici]PPF67128.1 DUF4184 domain-containing protein [Rathayibacter tritici]PPI19499.1 DUF4184 domain-containing protein [Rathayibacter tritici]PPI49154.1 DUF4184 domain-containing protein [Rathayibacter tritici]